MSRYFVHDPTDTAPAFYWRSLSSFARVPIHINLTLLAHALGDDPQELLEQTAPRGRLVPAKDYLRSGSDAVVVPALQPFAYTLPGEDRNHPRAHTIGPRLRQFLDDPLEGEPLDLSLPFYDAQIELGPNGGGWFRNNPDERCFHGATDFNTVPTSVFEVAAAREGRVLAKRGDCLVLSHVTNGGAEFLTVYRHVDLSTTLKDVNEEVRRGELLGLTDPTQDPLHLHFGVAVPGPAHSANREEEKSTEWYFIDPWGVYDVRAGNYLPVQSGMLEGDIAGATHPVQWRAEPVAKTLPVARSTGEYRTIERVQVRVRRKDNHGGTLPTEHDQFLVWLNGIPGFFLVPLAQATDRSAEAQLVNLLQEAYFRGRPIKVEYRYVSDLRYIMAVWSE